MSKKKNFNHVSGKKYDGMMGRCYRPSDRSYDSYGGAGIRVSKEWITDINAFRLWLVQEIGKVGVSIEEFVENSKHYQLDRLSSKGHYTASNCRITNIQGNSRNKLKGLTCIESAEGDMLDLKSDFSNKDSLVSNIKKLKEFKVK